MSAFNTVFIDGNAAVDVSRPVGKHHRIDTENFRFDGRLVFDEHRGQGNVETMLCIVKVLSVN